MKIPATARQFQADRFRSPSLPGIDPTPNRMPHSARRVPLRAAQSEFRAAADRARARAARAQAPVRNLAPPRIPIRAPRLSLPASSPRRQARLPRSPVDTLPLESRALRRAAPLPARAAQAPLRPTGLRVPRQQASRQGYRIPEPRFPRELARQAMACATVEPARPARRSKSKILRRPSPQPAQPKLQTRVPLRALALRAWTRQPRPPALRAWSPIRPTNRLRAPPAASSAIQAACR